MALNYGDCINFLFVEMRIGNFVGIGNRIGKICIKTVGLYMFLVEMFIKVRYTLAVAVVFDLVYIMITFLLTGNVLVQAFAFTFILFYIGLVWTTTNMDREEYNSYYVMMSTGKLMNLCGTVFGQQGRGRATAWLK